MFTDLIFSKPWGTYTNTLLFGDDEVEVPQSLASTLQMLPAFGQSAVLAVRVEGDIRQLIPDFTQSVKAQVWVTARVPAGQPFANFTNQTALENWVQGAVLQTLDPFFQNSEIQVQVHVLVNQTMDDFLSDVRASAPLILTITPRSLFVSAQVRKWSISLQHRTLTLHK